MSFHRILILVGMLSLTACAGMGRSCSAFNAESFGSDWIVVQYDMNLSAKNCWELSDVSITNEEHSDGIYWKDTKLSHLVHISGWYNRVQVSGKNFSEAAKLLGVDIEQCGNGVYPKTQ